MKYVPGSSEMVSHKDYFFETKNSLLHKAQTQHSSILSPSIVCK